MSGDEDYLRRRAVAGLLEQAGISREDFDFEEFLGDSAKPAEWFASVGTAPFLADRRTALVRYVLRANAADLPGSPIPATGLLILVADDEPGMEERDSRFARSKAAWEKAVSASGGAVLSPKAEGAGARAAVKTEAKGAGKQIADRAADVLLDMTGGSLSRSLEELEKLVVFVGDEEMISEADVRRVAVSSPEWNVYRMVDAILEGKTSEAMRSLRDLAKSSKKAEDAAFAFILPTTSRQLRLAWQARLVVENGGSLDRVPESVTRQFPERPNLLKERPFRQSAAMALARRAPLDRLGRCMEIVAETDCRLKGILPGFSGFETLEFMVLELSSVLTPRVAGRP